MEINSGEVQIMQYRIALSVVAIVLLPACVGCGRGKDLDLQEISGQVTFHTQPLANGTIQFAPRDQYGLAGGSVIADGRYVIPSQKGLPPGAYTVRISSADQSGGIPRSSTGKPGSEAPPLKEVLPDRYNSKSELTAEVKSGGGNILNFELR